MIKEYIVNKEDIGKRLDVFLTENMQNVSRSHIKILCEKGSIKKENEIFDRVGYKVRANDTFTVEEPETEKMNLEPQEVEFAIVFEDDDLAVIDKPQGLVVHPSQTTKSGTLVNGLLMRLDKLSGINGVARPGIVHRLDKDTSGLLVVAKNDFAHIELQKQIASKTAKRKYKAIVDGNVKEDEGVINVPIARSKTNRKIMTADINGRQSITEFRVLERFGKYTLTEFNLLTGRTHQIRAHCKYIHHPVIGDTAYGGSNEFGLKGQLLHAYELSFIHPTTKQQLTFNSDLPIYFENVLTKLRKKR